MENGEATSASPSKEQKTILINKKVKVVPIPRSGGWLPGGHDGEFMFTGTVFEFDLPLNRKTGRLVNILEEDEQEFFEKKLHMKEGDLSIYKKDDNFWHSFKVKLSKEDTILDLSDPMDNLAYKVCMVSQHVAPNWERRYESGSFKFALQDEEIVIQAKVTKANERKDAYKYLGKIENNAERMRNVLRVYGAKPAQNMKASAMYAALDDIIDNPDTLPKFLGVIQDPHFEMKIFIEDALRVGALKKKDTRYELPGGDKIGGTLQEAIDYLKDNENQDVYMRINNQIEVTINKQ